MWDADAAKRYEAWYQTPKGMLAIRREQGLVADMVSAWPRRGRSLLEVGCGTGIFLDLFYGGGFDVTGLDISQPMLDLARARTGQHATLRLGSAEHLPFDNDEFDYVAMITALEFMGNPEAALAEAFRVAMRGVLVVFLNSWSTYRIECALCTIGRRAKHGCGGLNHALDVEKWFSPYEMLRFIRKVSDRRPSSFRSVLFPPSFVWRFGGAHLPWLHMFPFGAVAAMRVDMEPATGTALPLSVRGIVPARQCYPATRGDVAPRQGAST